MPRLTDAVLVPSVQCEQVLELARGDVRLAVTTLSDVMAASKTLHDCVQLGHGLCNTLEDLCSPHTFLLLRKVSRIDSMCCVMLRAAHHGVC